MSDESEEVEEVTLDPGDLPKAEGSRIELSEDSESDIRFIEDGEIMEPEDE